MLKTVSRFLFPPDSRRRGSVTLMVVVLLVLLAVIGTAFISSSGTDRQAVRQNTLNTQVDLYVQGVVDQVKATVVDDLFSGGKYRPGAATPSSLSDLTSQKHRWDAFYSDRWISSRIPERTASNNNWFDIRWRNVSILPSLSNSGFTDIKSGQIVSSSTGIPFSLSAGESFERHGGPSPGVFRLNGVDLPAFPLIAGADPSNPDHWIIAADADGDGVADAGLFALGQQLRGGVNYFGAVRILDHNSAINVNTAFSRASDQSVGGIAGNLALFPANIGLQEILHDPSTEMGALNDFRFNRAATGTSVPNSVPIEEDGTQRQDFEYRTASEAMYRGVARRFDYPGILSANTNPFPRYQALGLDAAATLAYRFCMVDLNARRSDLETLLQTSVYESAPNYDSANPAGNFTFYTRRDNETQLAFIQRWYGDNFDFGSAGNFSTNGKPLRALLTTYNPTSSAIAPLYHDPYGKTTGHPDMLPYGERGLWRPDVNYDFGDVVTYRGQTYTSISINNLNEVPNPSQPGSKWSFYAMRGRWDDSKNTAGKEDYYPVWSAQRQYQPGDMALYLPGTSGAWQADEAAVYIAIQPSLGVVPPGTPTAWKRRDAQRWPTKASLNTASFAELWRAYWNVMGELAGGEVGTPGTTTSLAGPENPYYPIRAFHNSVLRDYRLSSGRGPDEGASTGGSPTETHRDDVQVTRPFGDTRKLAVELYPRQQMLLRAALAAVNTIDLRDGGMSSPGDTTNDPDYKDRHDSITSRTFQLMAYVEDDPSAAASATYQQTKPATPVEVTVFGYEPQPFITEVYVSNVDQPQMDEATGNAFTNEEGYVAVELYNPYPFNIYLNNWQLGILDRRSRVGATEPALEYPNMALRPLPGFTGFPAGNAVVVPANGYLILENFSETGAPVPAAQGRPQDVVATIAAAGNKVYVPGLHEVIARRSGGTGVRTGGELVLLRPRRLDGELSRSSIPGNVYDEGTAGAVNLHELVPVDSHDFTGVRFAVPNADGVTYPEGERFHVMHYARKSGAANAWQHVYPGNYILTRDGTYGGIAQARQSRKTSANNQDVMVDLYFGYERYAEPAMAAGTSISTGDHKHHQPGIQGKIWKPGEQEPPPFTGDPATPEAYTPTNFKYPILRVPPDPAMQPAPLNRAITFGRDCTVTNYSERYDEDYEFTNTVLPIPLASTDQPGPYASLEGGANGDGNRKNWFPFGGFMRSGDVLHVPFIGRYRVRVLQKQANDTYTLRNAPEVVLEMNAITMDAALAGLPADDSGQFGDHHLRENIGRFAPMNRAEQTFKTSNTPSANETPQEVGVFEKRDAYGWAADVLDYVTVLGSRDEYNADVAAEDYTYDEDGNYTIQYNNPPSRLPSQDPGFLYGEDDTETAPVHGLVNINTAPPVVLAQVPLRLDGTGNYDKTATEAAAVDLTRVLDRPAREPRVWLSQLHWANRLNAQQYAGANVNTPPPDPNDAQGDFSPLGNATDGVQTWLPALTYSNRNSKYYPTDYEGKFLSAIRTSNLITTRSDTFTAYVLIEGWADVGTPQARRVSQRRVAFILDRSQYTPSNPVLKIHNIPTN